jgi:hypothetical protein
MGAGVAAATDPQPPALRSPLRVFSFAACALPSWLLRASQQVLFPRPALGECCHRSLAGCLIAMCGRAVFMVDNGERPHPWRSTAEADFEDAADHDAISEHVVVVGTGDFNGDGTPDILQHQINTADGSMTLRDLVMSPNAVQVQSAQTMGTIGANIQVDGVGDFNGNGTADILAATNGNTVLSKRGWIDH